MVWRRLLLVLALSMTLMGAANARQEGCSQAAVTVSCPSASLGGGAANLGATQTTPGTPGKQGFTRPSTSGSAPSGPPVIVKCMEVDPALCSAPPPPAVGSSPITLADIASFIPQTPAQAMEPGGWTVVGLDTNFYSTIRAHNIDGTLLGQPATVRFTPVAFRWDYGDGSTATRTTSGSKWAAAGIREFDPTPTSHVYERTGDYTIRLIVSYSAAYRIGASGFVPIAGTLPVPANDLQVRVGTAKTVLVERDCAAAPHGPGC
ncbi:MAG TPA: hypothetical protein VNT53_10940 [Pseudolysinimonas sp.]|nr:hypothetical protein [Pseudolysinimonas sp.]